MNSKEYQEWGQDLMECVSGDSPQVSDRRLLQHAAECQSCGELLWIHLRLTAAEPNIPMPSAAQFADMRGQVLQRMTPGYLSGELREPSGSGTLKSLFENLFLNPLFAYALLILMVLSTAIYQGIESPPVAPWSSLLLSEIGREAVSSTGFQESSDSPYILSNLSIRPLAQDRVSLAFDVLTHLETVRNHDDPLVAEALVQSLISNTNLGAKLKAIAFSEEMPGRKVTEGLVYAALRDRNPAVRLSALGVLTQFENDPLVQRACLEILASDDAIQMRLIAVDYLGRNPEVLRQAIDQKWSQDPALRLRAATYLQ